MPKEFYYLCTGLIALIVVLVSTPLVKTIGLKTGRVDNPNERKVHDRPMVRLGGVAMFSGTLMALGVAWGLGWFPTGELSGSSLGVLLGAIAFFGIGFGDDLFELGALTRLAMQFIVASGAWIMGVRIEYLSIPLVTDAFPLGMLSLPLTLIWLVGMVNAINWIDGLDGLAAGVTAIAAGALFINTIHLDQPMMALMAVALLGATVGFLRYNFHPAQIFMGDGGSYFLGFLLAAMGTVSFSKTTDLAAIWLPYLVLAVPLVDMTTVVFGRLKDKVSPFKPDKRHLHHRLLAAGLPHRSTVLLIYALTLWTGSVAIAVAGFTNGLLYAGLASVMLGLVGWQLWRKRELSMPQE